MKWTMIAALLSATVLLGAAWGAAAAPQYLSNYVPHPVHLEDSAQYHFHHLHHHHHHELQHMEVSSRSAELEDPDADKR